MTSKVFMNKRIKGMLVVLALFVCTSFCLGQQTITVNDNVLDYVDGTIAGNGDSKRYGEFRMNGVLSNPNGNDLIIKPNAVFDNACGAYMNVASVNDAKTKGIDFGLMKNNKIITDDDNGGFRGSNIAGAFANDDIEEFMNVSLNAVRIKGGTGIKNVYGGRTKTGTVSSNTVIISNVVTIGENVYGGYVASSGTVFKNEIWLKNVGVNYVQGGRCGGLWECCK